MNQPCDLLLSLPPHMLSQFGDCEPAVAVRSFATCDPPGRPLGSGGGTAWVLAEAWKASGVETFGDWIDRGRRILIHGGGESRRLPAYAGAGKLFLPLPALRWARGQRLDQSLLDMQEPFLREALARSDSASRLMIASGDVVLRSGRDLPALPRADVVLLGMWADPEAASHFGVMFCDRDEPTRLRTFLQKPSPAEIRERSRWHPYLIDAGVWLLSARAVRVLMRKCGWDEASRNFNGAAEPDPYDLYGKWALHLGEDPLEKDDTVGGLSCAVAAAPGGEFYHFGKSGDMIDSMFRLQNLVADETRPGAVPSPAQPRQFNQNTVFRIPVRRRENHSLWIENSFVPETWTLAARHVITGVPPNRWDLTLREGHCLDVAPVDEDRLAIRAYGFEDGFSGPIGEENAFWIERPAGEWFEARGITFGQAGIEPDTDLQSAALFPVMAADELEGGFIQWLFDAAVEGAERYREIWLRSPRESARRLAQRINLKRLYRQRVEYRKQALPVMAAHGSHSLFYKLDLKSVAAEYAESGAALVDAGEIEGRNAEPLLAMHDHMFRSEVLRLRGAEDAAAMAERAAFRALSDAIVERVRQRTVSPRIGVLEDQIVWGRSPARIDLAGGWTDTPPYCLEHGGSVVNIAINLNGQPPIQVFARRSGKRALTIRSIDLGQSEELTTYEEVGNYRHLGNGFAVARAAFALAGFHPDFNGGAFHSLRDQLDALGAGIDISMLAAIPKGSGLGTSSILAGTLLGALSEFCDLDWDKRAIGERVSGLEQMLGSGGGWQDQYGGLLHGAKLLETGPGLDQTVSVRWLPGGFFGPVGLGDRMMLYYTGITRVARDVLGEIVRGMFLNEASRLRQLEAIGKNARACFDAIQREDGDGFCASVRRSWKCNCALDSGTNPAEVDALIDRISPYASAMKLSGAGGGGYLFLVAESNAAVREIRRILESAPPNERARFIDMELSGTGMQVTKS